MFTSCPSGPTSLTSRVRRFKTESGSVTTILNACMPLRLCINQKSQNYQRVKLEENKCLPQKHDRICDIKAIQCEHTAPAQSHLKLGQ